MQKYLELVLEKDCQVPKTSNSGCLRNVFFIVFIPITRDKRTLDLMGICKSAGYSETVVKEKVNVTMLYPNSQCINLMLLPGDFYQSLSYIIPIFQFIVINDLDSSCRLH